MTVYTPMQTITQEHWFGIVEALAEQVSPSLYLLPTVAGRSPAVGHRQQRYTGDWELWHSITGQVLNPMAALPLPWLRRFAWLLADAGIDATLTGNPHRKDHPQYTLYTLLADKVCRCWLHGAPVADLIPSITTANTGHTGMQCANSWCEDDFAAPAELLGHGEDGQDPVLVEDGNDDELFHTARQLGWSQLHRKDLWLCDTCTEEHEPAPAKQAQRLAFQGIQ